MFDLIPLNGENHDPHSNHDDCDPITQRLRIGDAREQLSLFDADSVDLVVTDPPYFLDGLDSKWKKGDSNSPRATGSVGGLPVGMKFDPAQGKALQSFMGPVAHQLIRVLKPGAFALLFSQPRLSHRMAIALEDVGFEIRDLCIWHYRGKAQFKAFKQDHFVKRMNITEHEKGSIIASMGGRKTPQLRGQHETIILAQKPRDGTFVANWCRWETGLMDASITLNGACPSNVMAVEKASRDELGPAASHLTPKPLKLLRHLIQLFSKEGQLVLDPFLGSGSTAVAAQSVGREWKGIELNADYAKMAAERIEQAKNGSSATKETERSGDEAV